LLRLNSVKKHVTDGGNTLTRIRSSKDTIVEITPLCKKIGVTRVSDITHLDKLCIPNYSAILPGTEDSIWVYSGKGITRADAEASALMEAIERYSSLSTTYSMAPIRGTFAELSKSYNRVLHPEEVIEPVNSIYNDTNSITDFLPGFDLMSHEMVLVPAQLALSRYSAEFPTTDVFPYSHTNGLASGNVLEEAVCHALYEVIERDATSIADLCASSIPYNIIERITDSLRTAKNGGYAIERVQAADNFVDDPTIFPEVDISEIANEIDPIKKLVNRFIKSGISLTIKEITQNDIGIPTFVASSIEWITHEYGYFAKGYGTHNDAKVALIRAITEMSQTRAVNIQGARDDLRKIQYKENDEIYKRKWPFMATPPQTTKQIYENKCKIKFDEIKTYEMDDILDDINLILNRLKLAGLKKIIIIDLTNPNLGIPVVRAIVPGLETFEVTQTIMGTRANKYFNERYHH